MTDAIIIIIVGIVAILIGLNTLPAKKKKLLREGEEVDGEISEIVEATGDEVTEYFPVVRFTTKKNQLVEKIVADLLISGVVREGAKVKVLYQTENPEIFVVKSTKAIWISRILTLVGIIALVAGAYLILKSQNII